MVCTINQSYKHTNKWFTLIHIRLYAFMSTLITASLKKTIVTQYENRTCACLRRQIRPNHINNLAMYYPFNTLNFGTGLIVFDWLIGAHDGLLKNTPHSFRENTAILQSISEDTSDSSSSRSWAYWPAPLKEESVLHPLCVYQYLLLSNKHVYVFIHLCLH